MRIISCYTPTYATYAEKLSESVELFGYGHSIEEFEDTGSWTANCAYKAEYIQRQLTELSEPVLWIDADATVRRELTLFEAPPFDFAVRMRGGELAELCGPFMSGTVYFGTSPQARHLALEWAFRCVDEPMTWDQKHLYRAWRDATDKPRTYYLEVGYCQKRDEEGEDPFIVHDMASRRLKR